MSCLSARYTTTAHEVPARAILASVIGCVLRRELMPVRTVRREHLRLSWLRWVLQSPSSLTLSAISAVAFSARTSRIRLPVLVGVIHDFDVASRVGMALRTVNRKLLMCRRAVHVLMSGHLLQVLDLDARRALAQVMQLISRFYVTNKGLIEHTVGGLGFAVVPHAPITFGVCVARPDSAITVNDRVSVVGLFRSEHFRCHAKIMPDLSVVV